MNRPLYTLLLYLASPALMVILAWRVCRHSMVRGRWREMTGRYPAATWQEPLRPVIFHAVSVGEVHAAGPLIESFLASHPDRPVLVTCSSVTGSERIQALFGNRVRHVFLPYDYPGSIGRFLDRFRPGLIVILETELWPNLIHCARIRDVRVLIANARLSERSRRGYARLGRLVRDMLGEIDCIAAQSQEDADRFRSIGQPGDITVTGNLKFDVNMEVDSVAARSLRRELFGERPVLIAASTREGEDEKILAAFHLIRAERPDLSLVLVPRHPERFQSAARLFRDAGYRVLLRSELGTGADSPPDVLVGDSMGELLLYYSLADIAFVGGSLVGTGCQNIIEPAALGLPVITGYSLYNFQQVSDELRRSGAQCVIQNERVMADRVIELLEDEDQRRAMADAAKQTVRQGMGATARTLAIVETLMAGSGTRSIDKPGSAV